MAVASDYAITTGYGQVAGYQLNNGFHKGEDRACPSGTPLYVNGMLIGLTGNSGECYDAQGRRNTPGSSHLHIGRWVGGNPTPPGGGGFSLPGATVYATGEDSTNGKWIQLSYGGAVWCFLHLSRIDVGKGQLINAPVAAPTQGDEMIANNEQAVQAYKLLRPNGGGSPDEINGTAGKRSWWQFVRDGVNEMNQRDANLRDQAARLDGMSRQINEQNQALADFQLKLQDAALSNDQKQQALDTLLATAADTNAKLAAEHDAVVQLQAKLSEPVTTAAPASPALPAAKSLDWLTSLLAFLTKWKAN